jgi:LSD1 subclass zinc finger protein
MASTIYGSVRYGPSLQLGKGSRQSTKGHCEAGMLRVDLWGKFCVTLLGAMSFRAIEMETVAQKTSADADTRSAWSVKWNERAARRTLLCPLGDGRSGCRSLLDFPSGSKSEKPNRCDKLQEQKVGRKSEPVQRSLTGLLLGTYSA